MTMNTNIAQAPRFAFAGSRTSVLGMIRTVLAVRHQRATLAKLDDSALLDLGLSRKDVQAEIRRPLWDVPANQRG